MLKRKMIFIVFICLVSLLLVNCNNESDREVGLKLENEKKEVNKGIDLKLPNGEEHIEASTLLSGKSSFEEVDAKSLKFNFQIEEERLIKLSLDNKVKEGSIKVELYDSNNEVYLNVLRKEYKKDLFFELPKGKYILEINIKDGMKGYYNYRVCIIQP